MGITGKRKRYMISGDMNRYESPRIEILTLMIEDPVLTDSDGYGFGVGDWEPGEDDGGVAD
jgi:hypothetical protein